MWKSSTWLCITVHSECGDGHGDAQRPLRSPAWVPPLPVANATITHGPLSHQVLAGDPMTLRCSVQLGSPPVTFTWLHNGKEVAWGPLLELRDVDVRHSGTYQCMATNQLDGHHVFRALSHELQWAQPPCESLRW
uniref:Ig-like domain-containing protein n=1 Tax=Serinus canaria TaxID=9135 RepID=A0A8C9UHX5_SERCA